MENIIENISGASIVRQSLVDQAHSPEYELRVLLAVMHGIDDTKSISFWDAQRQAFGTTRGQSREVHYQCVYWICSSLFGEFVNRFEF